MQNYIDEEELSLIAREETAKELNIDKYLICYGFASPNDACGTIIDNIDTKSSPNEILAKLTINFLADNEARILEEKPIKIDKKTHELSVYGLSNYKTLNKNNTLPFFPTQDEIYNALISQKLDLEQTERLIKQVKGNKPIDKMRRDFFKQAKIRAEERKQYIIKSRVNLSTKKYTIKLKKKMVIHKKNSQQSNLINQEEKITNF